MNRPYILVGAGGTGSIIFDPLTRLLENFYRHRDDDYTLTVIDGKEVSPSKLERQLFRGRHAGTPKATALIEQYECDPNVIIAVPAYLDDSNIDGITENAVVLIAADNFPVRARIERHAQTLQNVTVINGGNEMRDGSLQLYVRRNGKDVTPPMSQGHPELLEDDRRDPAALTCEQIAELPSGEQTIVANFMSAGTMLAAVHRIHQWETQEPLVPDNPFVGMITLPEEVFFDTSTFAMRTAIRPTGA